MVMKDNGQYALVTGGTSGIGYELAKLLAKDGYNLVLVARTESDLKRIAGELTDQHSITVETIATDLFDPQNAFNLYDQVRKKGISIHILVNDAGQGLYGEFIDTDILRELDIINLNISSLVILTKLYLREMVDKGAGKILNLASIASKLPGPRQSVYHATKAFVLSFTEAVRSEVKGKGVSITALLPGATDTDFFNKADMLDSKIVVEGNLDNPAKVAKDGYEALMSGDDKVVSGVKNKIQVAMANITPDEKVADKLKKQQAPVGEDK